VGRPHRQRLRTRKRRPQPQSAILGNEDGLRAEINTSSSVPCLSALCPSYLKVLVYRPSPFHPSPLFLLASSHAFGNSNISSCNMLEVTCILRTHSFFPSLFSALPLFLRTGICRMSYSLVFIHNIVTYSISPRVLGAQQSYSSNSPLSVFSWIDFTEGNTSDRWIRRTRMPL
jgi:hypothetical protein